MGTSLANRVGVLFGGFYLVLGVVSFGATGFQGLTQNGPDAFLGFSVNPMHNIAHIGIGLFLIILGLQKNSAAAEGAVMGVGLFYVVAFVIGVTAPDNLTILSMTGEGDPDNFLHLLSGVSLLAIGLISSGATAASMKKRGLT